MLARCPNCRATFSTDHTGRQECPTCKKPLVVPEQPVQEAPAPFAGPAFAPPSGPDAAPPSERAREGTPWEQLPAGAPPADWVRAWVDTMQLALFDPVRLFARARLDAAVQRRQAGFALLTFSVFSIVGQLAERAMEASYGPEQQKLLNDKLNEALAQLGDRVPSWVAKMLHAGPHPSAGAFVASLFLAPLIGFVFLYLNAGVTHLFSMIFGQNRRGFSATLAACAYGMAPTVLLAIPACGSLIAALWIIVLIGIGLKGTHGVSTGGAAAVSVGPYLLFCCFGCVAITIMVSVLGGSLLQQP